MKNDVTQLTNEERSALFPIILEEHSPRWHTWYEEEKANITAHVADIACIYHYGSTSIPHIMAKPIVDILIEVEKSTNLEKFKQSFLSLGYNYMNFGKAPSMMFAKGYTTAGFAERVFHVHIYYKGLQEEILFRDYLLSHPDKAKEYETLKLSLKEKYEFDRDGYTFAKSEFIESITNKALKEHKKAETT